MWLTARHLFASLLSALCPGSGHLILSRWAPGMLLSAIFVGLLCCFWPLRLLRYYWGLMIVFCSWFALAGYASGSAQLSPDRKTGTRISKWWLALTLPAALFIASLTGAVVTRVSGFRSFEVPSTSMEPTIQRGDHIVVDTHAFRSRAPHFQDVIVCQRNHTFFIKRVIGVGGSTLQGRNDGILLDGQLINESYIQHSETPAAANWQALGEDPAGNFGPVKVPPGKYFVMGDNRDVSLDSRSPGFGLVDGTSILGTVLYVYRTSREGARIR